MTTKDLTHRTTATALSPGVDIGLLILRLGVGAAVLQAGLIKATDLGTATGFMAEAGWRLPTLAAAMVTAAETLGGLGLILGVLTPLAGCAVFGAMLCAWAVNVSTAAFWAEPFNVPFLLGVGAVAAMFAGAGHFSVDARALRRITWSTRVTTGLVALGVLTAVVTWVALLGVNPIHLTDPTP
jgi:putative oxidoreductase